MERRRVPGAGLAGVTSVSEVPAGYIGIYTAEDLDAVRKNIYGKYILMNDIDLSGYANWEPIGGGSSDFRGTFDGNGHVIRNLKIDRASEDYVGLFGRTYSATIKNVGLENVDVKGGNNTGGLVGYTCDNITISNISNSYVQGNVSGKQNTGGLVGYNYKSSTITDCYANVKVTGTDSCTGGLVGCNSSSTITNSYAQGTVLGKNYTGGLVGYNIYSTITNSYANVNVTAPTSYTGGLVGHNYSSATITNSFWDKEKSGRDKGIGGNAQSDPAKASVTGLTTSEMADPKNFIDAGWDSTLWDFTSSPPRLARQPQQEESGGNLRLQIGANGDESSVIRTDTIFEIGAFSVDFSDEEASRASIDTVDEMLEKLTKKYPNLGRY